MIRSNEVTGVGPNPTGLVSLQEEEIIHTRRDDHVRMREKTAVSTPRREAPGGAGPTHAWTLDSSLQDGGQRPSAG